MYIGILLHAQTRKRGLVDRLFDLGISASYDRVLEVSIDLGNTVSTRFQQQQVVVPTNFHKGVLTTGAVDNIDYNPSSNTATGSFHGTGISLFQHPDVMGQGHIIENVAFRAGLSTTLKPLPDFYANIPPISTNIKNAKVPKGFNYPMGMTSTSDTWFFD